ncbi:5'-methylthioadenosine/S-adenosylhomocysteine nucleosidase [Virgisporangium ochraceum]|uniref:Purine phosphorylase n=1 Tax=Virgisporangium ochraceum TaxID=65505 RepID=A0A8J4A703_9ACTN|nr:5'-methylthioadenosine/S-adenosylhomocysteine nucleosidase [Virgisporangium ochraceum]GIJ74001.1 purine phosphorylase [Virgisporangium ochraceum]
MMPTARKQSRIEVPSAEVAFLTALGLEYQAVRDLVTAPEPCQHAGGTLFEVGRLNGGGCRVAMVRTGQGNTASALIAERAIAMFQPQALLFVGVAGALNDEIDLGDVVVATKVYAFHGGKDDRDGFLARPQTWNAPHELEQLAGYIAQTMSWTDEAPAVHLKPVAAGEVLLDSLAGPVVELIRRHYNDAVAIDMESGGAALAGHLNHSLPVLSIRGISDHANGGKRSADRSGWQRVAARNAAEFAVALASHLVHDHAP